jgi:phosphate transport system ATP-binding protein
MSEATQSSQINYTYELKNNSLTKDTINDVCIKAENVNVWYGNNHALKDVNIDIQKNKITAFIGPSGCGKTTFLKCLNRMNDLISIFRMEGKITVDGDDLYSNKQDTIKLRQRIGMVFQQPNPFPKTIYENLKLPIVENYGRMSKKKIDEIIENKLRAASLYDEVHNRLNKSAHMLSGGQQQRLCIARTLTINPEIILFDEPCAALDHISTLKIENMLTELKEKYTIIIVTHNLQQATRIADNVAFFYQGKIEEQGPAYDIFVNPKSQLTQDYIQGVF